MAMTTMATKNEYDWGGYQALRFVVQHALYVRDDKWITTMIEQVDLHLQTGLGFADDTDKMIPWQISEHDECFTDSAIEAILIWLNCGADFRKWFITELNDHNGHLMNEHEEQSLRNDRELLEQAIIELEQEWVHCEGSVRNDIKAELDRLTSIAKKMDDAKEPF
jgi:hypothetical protein